MPRALPPFDRTFAGAVKLARSLKNDFVDLRHSSQGNVTPGFLNAVKEHRPNAEVFFIEDPGLSSFFYILRTDDKCEVVYGITANKCYRRFGVCKELCHILTDDAQVRTTSPTFELQLAISVRTKFLLREQTLFTDKLKSEEFCIFLALEIMLPEARREEILTRARLGDNHYDIAKLFDVPEAYIAFFIESQYHTHWQKVWETA